MSSRDLNRAVSGKKGCNEVPDKLFNRFYSIGFPIYFRLFQEVEDTGQRQTACQHPHVRIPLFGPLFYHDAGGRIHPIHAEPPLYTHESGSVH